MSSTQKKVIFFVLVIFVSSLVLIGWRFSRKSIQPPLILTVPSQVVPSSMSPNSIPGFKTYQNEEYGFRFQYTDNLIIKENTFGSPNSKFNLQVLAKKDDYLDPVFEINVALPEFADHTFFGLNPTTSTIIIDGASGIKYEYKFENMPETSIVLPLGQYKIILFLEGVSKFYGYEKDFNKILATFKFLK